MKRLTHYLLKTILPVILLVTITEFSSAQCPAGYSKFTLKWDYLDFFIYNAQYTSTNGYLPNLAAAQTQTFSFGNQRLVISHNYVANAFSGDNQTHTGEAGSYGNGNTSGPDADVQFIGNGQIVLTFDAEVSNLQFSLFDVDNLQQVNITAVNGAGVAQPIDFTALGTPVLQTLAITNNHTTTPQAVSTPNSSGLGRNVATSAVYASFNVDVAGPVKQVTIAVTNSGSDVSIDNGSFWLSDITACTPGAFPTNYYNTSKPFTGQPSYILHSLDKTVYALDPATGKTKAIFTDAAVATYINSMAYDPYNKFLYYVSNGAATPGSNRSIKKYDFNTETISTVLADINTIGIPTSSAVGVESGGAAFYNGSLYLGLQTTNSNSTSGRESIIWRIDFNGSNVPYRACQAYALPTDDGSGLLHAWGDFSIKDGVLFDSDNSGNDPDMYQFNMSTGLATIYAGPGFELGEITQDWAGNMYALSADIANGFVPNVAIYNQDGTIGTQFNIFSNPAYSLAIPNLGDAAEAYHPKSDFGDAPASYDASGEPANHEKDVNLKLGNGLGATWSKTGTVNGDANDDGMGAAPSLDYFGTTTYSISVNVYNNTGANATMVAWLDWNFNGVYDPGEGRSITVPSSASMQLVPLSWTMWVPYTTNTNTWLRVRLTSASNSMTVNNMVGYFSNGEVEDYPVVMGSLLGKDLLSFTASMNSRKAVGLQWQENTFPGILRTNVERSSNGLQWDSVASVDAYQSNSVSLYGYSSTDDAPLQGVSYYRLKIVYNDGTVHYSDTRSVNLTGTLENSLHIFLNPADQYTTLKINSTVATTTTIDLTDNTGRLLIRRTLSLNAGENFVRINDLGKYSSGLYYVNVKTTVFSAVEKLIIKRE